mmetsp:Transcript_20106/g.67545  ORF Transcript_20106/g.67545 Transcript_20106/m.67545 type:complete len:256 (-) Transcript_20106:124-891(-)
MSRRPSCSLWLLALLARVRGRGELERLHLGHVRLVQGLPVVRIRPAPEGLAREALEAPRARLPTALNAGGALRQCHGAVHGAQGVLGHLHHVPVLERKGGGPRRAAVDEDEPVRDELAGGGQGGGQHGAAEEHVQAGLQAVEEGLREALLGPAGEADLPVQLPRGEVAVVVFHCSPGVDHALAHAALAPHAAPAKAVDALDGDLAAQRGARHVRQGGAFSRGLPLPQHPALPGEKRARAERAGWRGQGQGAGRGS